MMSAWLVRAFKEGTFCVDFLRQFLEKLQMETRASIDIYTASTGPSIGPE